MRLTRYTDYSLRVLLYLGTAAKGRTATIQEIADVYGISKNHLTKVVHQLGQLGYIQTVRGRYGGIQLEPSVMNVSLGAIIRQTEDDFELVECFSEQGNCILSPACQLKQALQQAMKAYFEVLDDLLFHTLVDQPDRYAQLFNQVLSSNESLDSPPEGFKAGENG